MRLCSLVDRQTNSLCYFMVQSNKVMQAASLLIYAPALARIRSARLGGGLAYCANNPPPATNGA